jgi:hypothetical protein
MWDWICGWWASPEFKGVSDRNRQNRKSKPGLHRYGADGHVRKKTKGWYDTHISVPHLLRTYLFIMLHFVLQRASFGVDPHYLDVWVPMHRDDDTSAEKLVSTNLYI